MIKAIVILSFIIGIAFGCDVTRWWYKEGKDLWYTLKRK